MPPVRSIKSKLSLPVLAFFIFWLTFFALVWHQQIITTPQGISAGTRTTWGDGAAHLSYTSAFAYRDSFPNKLPIYSSHSFTYPFVADALTALLVKLGLPLFFSYTFLGFILSVTSLLAIYLVIKSIFNSSILTITSATIFLTSGGLGFFWFIRDALDSGPITTILNLPREYTHLPGNYIEFINTIHSTFIPQRSFLLGLPLGLFLLFIAHKLLTKPEQLRPAHLILTGALLGLMPIIHPHTTLVLGVFYAWIFALTITKPGAWRRWLLTIIPSALIGLPLILTFILPSTHDSFFSFYPGWLAKTHSINWFWFWLLNWGLFPYLAIFGFFKLSRSQKLFIAPFFFLFIIANLFLFQPWDWDNSKIFIWVYLGLSIPVAVILRHFFQHNLASKLLAAILFASIIFSGSLDNLRLLIHPNLSIPLYTNEELTLTEFTKTNTPPDSTFLTSDKHNHFIPNLTGRQVVMGFRGWLWSYGINYHQTNQDVLAIYSGSNSAKELINQYNIDYIIIGPSEISGFSANSDFFDTNFPVLTRSQNYTIYQAN